MSTYQSGSIFLPSFEKCERVGNNTYTFSMALSQLPGQYTSSVELKYRIIAESQSTQYTKGEITKVYRVTDPAMETPDSVAGYIDLGAGYWGFITGYARTIGDNTQDTGQMYIDRILTTPGVVNSGSTVSGWDAPSYPTITIDEVKRTVKLGIPANAIRQAPAKDKAGLMFNNKIYAKITPVVYSITTGQRLAQSPLPDLLVGSTDGTPTDTFYDFNIYEVPAGERCELHYIVQLYAVSTTNSGDVVFYGDEKEISTFILDGVEKKITPSLKPSLPEFLGTKNAYGTLILKPAIMSGSTPVGFYIDWLYKSNSGLQQNGYKLSVGTWDATVGSEGKYINTQIDYSSGTSEQSKIVSNITDFSRCFGQARLIETHEIGPSVYSSPVETRYMCPSLPLMFQSVSSATSTGTEWSSTSVELKANVSIKMKQYHGLSTGEYSLDLIAKCEIIAEDGTVIATAIKPVNEPGSAGEYIVAFDPISLVDINTKPSGMPDDTRLLTARVTVYSQIAPWLSYTRSSNFYSTSRKLWDIIDGAEANKPVDNGDGTATLRFTARADQLSAIPTGDFDYCTYQIEHVTDYGETVVLPRQRMPLPYTEQGKYAYWRDIIVDTPRLDTEGTFRITLWSPEGTKCAAGTTYPVTVKSHSKIGISSLTGETIAELKNNAAYTDSFEKENQSADLFGATKPTFDWSGLINETVSVEGTCKFPSAQLTALEGLLQSSDNEFILRMPGGFRQHVAITGGSISKSAGKGQASVSLECTVVGD